MTSSLEPIGLSVAGETISIEWSDSHRSKYSFFKLRSECPCAMCKGEPGVFGKEYSGMSQVIPEGVEPQEINTVGRYALKVVWSDGHDAGIYPYGYLRSICECDSCATERSLSQS